MNQYLERPNSMHRMAVLIIALLAVAVYSNTLNCGFIFDDQQNIIQNPYIRITDLDFKNIYDAAFKSHKPTRPLANVSFALNYYAGGFKPAGYHLVNLLVHLTNGVLVYFLAMLTLKLHHTKNLQIKSSRSSDIAYIGTALFAALMFIVHPVQVQSVTYIVQRMTTMATLFYLSALMCYVCSRLAQTKLKRRLWQAGCLICWILALGSKEIAATLPLVVMLYEWFFFQNLSTDWLKQNLKYIIGLAVVLGVVAYVFMGPNPFDTIIGSYAHRDFTLKQRVLTQFRVIVYYLSLLFYPHPARLNLIHYITTSKSLLNPVSTLFSLLVLLLLLGLAVYLAKKQRVISFCIFWFFIHLMIESSVIGLEMIFEHRLYLPMFGFCLLASYVLFKLFANRPTYLWIVTAVIIVSLATGSYLRNRIWQNPITMWSDVVAKSPQSPRAHYNLASDLARQGRNKEALYHFSEALRLKPDYGKAHNNLGLTLFNEGKFGRAAEHFAQALRIHPGNAAAHYNLGLVSEKQGDRISAANQYLKALKIKPDFAAAHNSLGLILQLQGRLKEAVYHFSKALESEPKNADIHNNMGSALETQGNIRQAVDHYLTALRIRPQDARTYNNLGVALTRQGVLNQAVRCYLEALRLAPNDAVVHNNLGVVFQRQGKLTAAVDHYARALVLMPEYAEAHNNMGIVLMRQGRYKAAVEHFSAALRIRPDDAQARHNLSLARRAIDKHAQDGNTEAKK